MNINDLTTKLFKGTITGDEYTQLNTHIFRYFNAKYPNVNVDDIEDCIANVNAKLHTTDKFDWNANIKPITYYYKAIFNEINNYIRSANRAPVMNPIILEDRNTYLVEEDALEEKYERDKLLNNIELKVKEEHILLYEYTYNNLSYQDLADKYKLSLQTVKNRIYGSKLKLQDYYTGRGYLVNKRKKQNKAYKDGKVKRKYVLKKGVNNNGRPAYPVLQYTLDGELIKEWESHIEAQHELNINSSNMILNLKGITKSAGGYVWKKKEIEQ